MTNLNMLPAATAGVANSDPTWAKTVPAGIKTTAQAANEALTAKAGSASKAGSCEIVLVCCMGL